MVDDSSQSVRSSGDSVGRAEARTEPAVVIAEGGETMDQRSSAAQRTARLCKKG